MANGNNNSVVELPWTGTGYGSQITLPFSGLNNPNGIALDSAGDVFVANWAGSENVVELPKTSTGYGPQTTLPFSGLSRPIGVALDGAGDVFIAENWPPESALELPKTATGYGQQTTLAATGLFNPEGVAVDSAGDLFIGDTANYRWRRPSRSTSAAQMSAHPEQRPRAMQPDADLTAINADTTLGEPQVATGGLKHLDFNRASGSTCIGAVTAGATCTVNVTFTPLAAGFRQWFGEPPGGGHDITTTQLSGFGIEATTGAPGRAARPANRRLHDRFRHHPNLPAVRRQHRWRTLTVTPSISGPSYKIADSTCASRRDAGK